MPYLTETELKLQLGPRGLRGLGATVFGRSVAPAAPPPMQEFAEGTGELPLSFKISSSSPNSLFNGSAWDPDKKIHIKTTLNYENVPVTLDIPLREFMVPLERMGGRQAPDLKPPTTESDDFSESMFKRATGSVWGTKLFNGTPIGYEGFVIALPYVKAWGATDPMISASPLTGRIDVVAPNGAVIGSVNYFWARRRGTQPTATRSFSGEGRVVTPAALLSWEQAYSAKYTSLRFKGREYLWGPFVDVVNPNGYECLHVTPGGKRQPIGPSGRPDISWDGMPPATTKEIDDYYNTTDPQVLVDQGYPETDAYAEVLNRAKLRGQFPLTKCITEFQHEVYDHLDSGDIGRALQGYSPDDRSLIVRVMNRAPQDGMFCILSTEIDALLAAVKSKLGSSDAEGRDYIHRSLSAAISDVERVEVQRFGWLFYVYCSRGMMPGTMINYATWAYNKRQKESAKNAARQGMITNVISLALNAIPVVGTAFSIALYSANAYSNVQAIKAQADSARRESQAVRRETAVTTEAIEEYQEEKKLDQAVEVDRRNENAKKTMKWAAIGTGAVAAVAAGISAMRR